MTELKEPNAKRSILAISETAKLDQTFLAAHPNVPRGAMSIDGVSLNHTPPNKPQGMSFLWPTTIAGTTYLNMVSYNMETKKLDDNSYNIGKCVVTGDSFTVYYLPFKTSERIRSRLGDDYNSADLLQEITKATDWEPFCKFDRIRL
jgi:hypothetical protein